MFEKWKVPLYRALKTYIDSHPIPFHMPGHKMGAGLPNEYLKELAQLDLTEVPGCDQLHYPKGAIKEAQSLAAEAFGADTTWFLVNGSSCGIHAMILSICQRGDTLIVGRDCHSAVVHAMMLAGVKPVYILPEYEPSWGISKGISPKSVHMALEQYPQAVGVFITRPNYYGICSDLQKIAEITHAYGKVLLVDEAHGAHWIFHPKLPITALQAGADACVQSAHKTLPAFTQGALLHVKSSRIDQERLAFFLRMLQTTSPSYMVMSSLDIAREILQREGHERLEALLHEIEVLERHVSRFENIQILKGQTAFGWQRDPTRVVLSFEKAGMTGFSAEKHLREAYGIQVEMSDLYNVVLITTLSDRSYYFERLRQAIEEIAVCFIKDKAFADIVFTEPKAPQQILDLDQVMYKQGVKVHWHHAIGRVSKGMVTPYPPGIPWICPGELITQEAVAYIKDVLKGGGIVQGILNHHVGEQYFEIEIVK